jgi:ketosteroid isomerase-like protein
VPTRSQTTSSGASRRACCRYADMRQVCQPGTATTLRRPVSNESIELVKSAFDAWNRGDFDTFANHLAEDVAWLEVSGRPEGGAAERLGRDRLRQSLESLFDAWESYRLEVQQIHDVGDRVVAVVREVARGRASGVEIDGLWGYLIAVGDGEIVRIEAYRDAQVALERAGLGKSATGA